MKEKAQEIAELVEQKSEAYGNSFHRVHKVLEELYPKGIQIAQYSDLLPIIRLLDKVFRIAHNMGVDPMGENPWEDIMGYALLSSSREEK